VADPRVTCAPEVARPSCVVDLRATWARAAAVALPCGRSEGAMDNGRRLPLRVMDDGRRDMAWKFAGEEGHRGGSGLGAGASVGVEGVRGGGAHVGEEGVEKNEEKGVHEAKEKKDKGKGVRVDECLSDRV
jgi:hypothetical protein